MLFPSPLPTYGVKDGHRSRVEGIEAVSSPGRDDSPEFSVWTETSELGEYSSRTQSRSPAQQSEDRDELDRVRLFETVLVVGRRKDLG
jgi:hypothetical protein